MRISKGLTLVLATAATALVGHAAAAGPGTVSTVYTVPSDAVSGLDTGYVVKSGQSVSLTATGAVCPWGTSLCVGPDGDSSYPTGTGGFLLPDDPAWGLVARVGSGPWTHVGSGPTPLSGSGVLVLAVNDNYFPDNLGAYRVTLSTKCWPGWGYGDVNHVHCGPPGLANKPPPPGQANKPSSSASGEQGSSQGNGSSNGNGNGSAGGNGNGNGGSRQP